MPWLSLMPIFIWALICIPIFVLFWFIHPTNRLMLFLVWLAYTSINLVCFMMVNWALLNYYLRFAPLALAFGLLLHWQKPLRNTPWLPERNRMGLGGVFGVLLFMGFPVYLLVGVYRSSNLNQVSTIPLLSLYPVRTGLYVIANGGNNQHGWGLNNYGQDWLGTSTNRDEEKLFAIDILEMRTNGMIADGVLDKNFLNYEIFTEPVYSPCMGVIVFVDDGRPDIPPYSRASGPQDQFGNRITIQCSDFLVTLANLRSITVQAGDEVSFNRIVAQVGNTASNSIPSLHMYVTTLDGTPVPILFEDGYRFNFVSRNHVYVR
jgi:hypothetical protein